MQQPQLTGPRGRPLRSIGPGVVGIYRIRNGTDGKLYIGSSVDIRQRFYDHRKNLAAGTHDNDRLQKAWRKHGEAAFAFEVVERCARDVLHVREQRHLDLVPDALRYNIGPVAASPTMGRVVPDEQRIRQSRTKGGRRVVAINLKTRERRVYEVMSFVERDGFNRESVQMAVNGDIQQHAGWAWFYEGEERDDLPPADRALMLSRAQGGRPVVGVNIETGAEVRFAFAKQAAAHGFHVGAIHHCLRGKYKSTGGHFWFYDDEPRPPPPARWGNAAKSNGKAIVGTNVKTGEVVRFDYVNKAREAGFNTNAIRNCIDGRAHTSQGYVWRYEAAA